LHYPLVANPIMGNTCLTKVLMDGGNNLNILYISTLDKMASLETAYSPSRHHSMGSCRGRKPYTSGASGSMSPSAR
jgi:hypothetical protein